MIKHLKVSDAIKLLGVSQTTLSVWEDEPKSPSIEKLKRMADVYEVSTDYLLGRISTYKSHPVLYLLYLLLLFLFCMDSHSGHRNTAGCW